MALQGRVRGFVAASVVSMCLLGVIAPAAHAASTTSPKQWASSVCSDVHTWIDSSKAALKNLKNATSLASASQQASTAIDAATSELVSSLKPWASRHRLTARRPRVLSSRCPRRCRATAPT